MKLTLNTYLYYISYVRFEGSGLFPVMKTDHEERTGKMLEEIERAERIFRKMCDCGKLEEEIDKARDARQAAAAIRRIIR